MKPGFERLITAQRSKAAFAASPVGFPERFGVSWEEGGRAGPGRPASHPSALCPAPQHTFSVGQDSSRSVACMVDSSLGVWVTLKGSAHVCLYHPDTFEQLAEVDVTPPVHRMLAGTDLPLPVPSP